MPQSKNPTKSDYHHGNLREAALNEGCKFGAGAGIDRISVKKIADSLQVSSSAVLRHFGSLESLKAQVAEKFRDQFTASAVSYRMSAGATPWSKEKALQVFDGYFDHLVGFARAHPIVYADGFRGYRAAGTANDTGRAPSMIAGAFLELAVSGIFDREFAQDAAVIWFSTVHGYAMLQILTIDHPESIYVIDKTRLDGVMKKHLRKSLLTY